jgi:hypothetical protein
VLQHRVVYARTRGSRRSQDHVHAASERSDWLTLVCALLGSGLGSIIYGIQLLRDLTNTQICYTIDWQPTNQRTLDAEVILQKKTKETVGDGLFNDLDYDDRLSREI